MRSFNQKWFVPNIHLSQEHCRDAQKFFMLCTSSLPWCLGVNIRFFGYLYLLPALLLVIMVSRLAIKVAGGGKSVIAG